MIKGDAHSGGGRGWPSQRARQAAASALTSDGWFRVSLAWMIFAVAAQTKGLGLLLVAAM